MNIPASEKERRKQQSMKDKRKSSKPQKKNSKTTNGSSFAVGTARKAPVGEFREFRSFSNTSPSSKSGNLRMTGMDYVGQVTSNGTTVGQILFNLPVAPFSGLFSGTRLAVQASTFEKYIFRRIRFHMQTASPTTIGGSYVMAFDRDVSDPLPPGGEGGIKQLFSNQNSRTAAVWQSQMIDISLSDSQTFYYTNYVGNEPRLAYQGRFLSAITTASPMGTNVSFNLWVEYDIDLMDPALDNTDATTALVLKDTIIPKNYSVSHMASTILSSSGDPVQTTMSNPAFVSGTQFNGNFNSSLGFNIPSGQWLMELVASPIVIANASSFIYDVYYVLSLLPNVTAGIPAVVKTIGAYLQNFNYLSSITTVTGEPGYKIVIPSGSAVNSKFPSIMQFLLDIPPGGAVADLMNFVNNLQTDNLSNFYQPKLRLNRISSKEFTTLASL